MAGTKVSGLHAIARRRSSIAGEMLLRTRIDKSTFARANAAHLQDDIFLDLDVMRNIRRLGVEAARGQDFQVGWIKFFSIASCERARQDRDLAKVWMRVRCDLET